MGVLENLDLLSVGIVVAATGVLGFTAYFQDRKSATSNAFLFFSVVTAFWGALTYAEYHVTPEFGIWFLRLSLFFAVWQAYSLFHFFSVFPNRKYVFRSIDFFLLFPVITITAFLALTPLVLNHVTSLNPDGTIATIANGPAVSIFGVVSVVFVVWGLWIFLRKTFFVHGSARRPYLEILSGTFLTFALIITFNFILPAFFNISRFVPLGSVFVFPFVAFTAYAILREHLFNIKVVATSALVFALSIMSFGEILFSDTFLLVIFRTSVFVLVLIFGVNLIRGVLHEVRQREKIEKLAKELTETNARQENLIHFVSHEVKGFLTKDAGAFATLADGDLGELPDEAKPFIEQALAQTREGVRSVMSILQAANLKKGTVSYKMEPFDLKALVKKIFGNFTQTAAEKGLAFTLSVNEKDGPYTVVGDAGQIGEHVLRNLIENAINYTLSGSVAVSLDKAADGRIIFSVQDTGVGITYEDKARLFTEGGHGKDSIKVNAHSTGYGLYIAKSVVEAHKGTVRAESEGQGSGSRFVVELPVVVNR